MLDAAAKTAGGRVLMVSSLDEDHGGENVIDADERSYWISTGLFPQEILLQLCRPCWVSSFKLSTTHVRSFRLEGCHEDAPVNFQVLADVDLVDARGALQVKEVQCGHIDRPILFIRLYILSGWHDFCSVHRFQVHGTEAPMPASAAAAREEDVTSPTPSALSHHSRTSLARRNSKDLFVQIPPHDLNHGTEPDAPRSTREPWTGDQAKTLGLGVGLGDPADDDPSAYEFEPLSPGAPNAGGGRFPPP